jgi:hypothetical protein
MSTRATNSMDRGVANVFEELVLQECREGGGALGVT